MSYINKCVTLLKVNVALQQQFLDALASGLPGASPPPGSELGDTLWAIDLLRRIIATHPSSNGYHYEYREPLMKDVIQDVVRDYKIIDLVFSEMANFKEKSKTRKKQVLKES